MSGAAKCQTVSQKAAHRAKPPTMVPAFQRSCPLRTKRLAIIASGKAATAPGLSHRRWSSSLCSHERRRFVTGSAGSLAGDAPFRREQPAGPAILARCDVHRVRQAWALVGQARRLISIYPSLRTELALYAWPLSDRWSQGCRPIL